MPTNTDRFSDDVQREHTASELRSFNISYTEVNDFVWVSTAAILTENEYGNLTDYRLETCVFSKDKSKQEFEMHHHYTFSAPLSEDEIMGAAAKHNAIVDVLSRKFKSLHIATIPACCGKCQEHPDFPNEDSI